MKATLIIKGAKKFELELGFEDFSQIVSNLPDTAEHADLFDLLSEHPSIAIREYVAMKDNLAESTVKRLAADRDVSVIRSLLRSSKGQEFLSTAQLLEMISRDVEAAESVANQVEAFDSADIDELAAALLKHGDARVRNSLAGNSSAPKKILKTLLKDPDPNVRASAQQSLD
ncbi:MAG: hypothetical protein ACK44L_06335 [Burkholderiales bacterium]|jgi:hypothetical protein